MRKTLIVLLLVVFALSGCALSQANEPQTRIQHQAAKLKQAVQPQTVHVVQQAYLGADPVKIDQGAMLPFIFSQKITLRTKVAAK